MPPLPGGSAITVEPGGAVELSGPPIDGAPPAIAAMTADRAVLRSAFAEAGLGLVLLGADPLRPAKRVNPGDRYRAMERFFAASQTGDAGAAMMTSTASVQLNLDAGPQDGWAARVRLAHALGPDDDRDRRQLADAGRQVHRLASPPGSGCGASWIRRAAARSWATAATIPATDWARYALKAPVMLVHNPDAVAGDGLGALRRLGRRQGPARRPQARRMPTSTIT